jgi:hypothetical protein
MSAESPEVTKFHQIQQQLIDMWPDMTLRTNDGPRRTVIVVSSLSVDLPDHMAPLATAYEERYLCYVLLLAKAKNTRVVYVTSLPMLPRLVDYYLTLIPGLDPHELRERLTVVSLSDGSFRPLTQKILERPRVIERLRQIVDGSEHKLLIPFMSTELEAQLGLALQTPVYGPDPSLAFLGSKSGSRQVFARAGHPGPQGVEGVRTLSDVTQAIEQMQGDSQVGDVMLKLDEGVSGLGNAVVRLPQHASRSEIERAIRSLEAEDATVEPQGFLEALERTGGVVEELVTGDDFCSPSVQLRASPLGEVEILSTHDQVLGGTHHQTYLGCKFPANDQYATALVEPGLAIGKELASRGVIGRFGIDFVATRQADAWSLRPVEVNLRNGGTTHPMLTLQALTDTSYDAEDARLVSRGRAKTYLATDHMHHPAFATLTPDDLLDVIAEADLGWDEDTHTGIAFHMASAIAVAGDIGVTAIGDSPKQAQWLYDAAKHALIGAVSPVGDVESSPERSGDH